MPRQARIDAPSALHHIICRGIERRNIFKDNTDRNRFLERLGSVLQKTSTPCYGWALIPNHFHLLLKTGKEPIAQIMRRLLTGYAVTFNTAASPLRPFISKSAVIRAANRGQKLIVDQFLSLND